jgi:hypothetical protein
MSSNDSYQHRRTWLDKLKHEYEEMAKEELISGPFCIQKDDKGDCLMSIQYVMIDMNEPDGRPRPFCEQLKEQNQQYDKTI